MRSLRHSGGGEGAGGSNVISAAKSSNSSFSNCRVLTLGMHARSEGYCSCPVCVCVCVSVRSFLPPRASRP